MIRETERETMSNFDVLNTKHVMILAGIIAECEQFGTPSDQLTGAAEHYGLVPTDLDELKKEIEDAAKLVAFKDAGIPVEQVTGRPELINEIGRFMSNILVARETVKELKQRGLLKLNEEGDLVYDKAALAEDGGVRSEIEEVVKERILGLTKEKNEEQQDEGSEERSEEVGTGSGVDEQEEAHDEGGDASVSAPLAA